MRLFQINEDDLAELERSLPDVALWLMDRLDTRSKMKLRRCQQILSNVRWNYGPPSEAERIEAGDGGIDEVNGGD